jgi:uncharacterized protein (DUF2249 family)
MDLDVRPYLGGGEDPFARIHQAWSSLPPGEVLRVIAPFEPRPLAAFFSQQGVPVRPERKSDEEHWLWIGPKPC